MSDFQTALAVALPVVLGALLRLPMGILAERYGGRRVFTLLMAFAIFPAACIALVHSYAGLLIGGFFLGVAGSSFAVGVSATNKWFPPEKQGLALGLFGHGTGAVHRRILWAALGEGDAVGGRLLDLRFGQPRLGLAPFWLLAQDAAARPCLYR